MAKADRLDGIDIARAFAIFGMVIVNYKIAMDGVSDSRWLSSFAAMFEGRASALFVLLAGIGISLMSAKARRGDTVAAAGVRNTLIKRGALLFVIGLLYTPIWPADILHFYGVYFAVAALLFARSDRVLLGVGGLFIVLFPLLMLVFDYDKGWNWQDYSYQGFWTVDGMFRHLLFNGFHPVVPWTAFLLFGLWLGRQDLSNPVVRQRFTFWSAVTLVGIEAGLWSLRQWLATDWPAENVELLLSVSIIPPMPQYMLSATASSVLILMLCLAFPRGWLDRLPCRILIATGQLSLTLYVAHVLVGMGALEALGLLQSQSLELALFSALLFCLSGALFSYIWCCKFAAGPLEWAFRKLG